MRSQLIQAAGEIDIPESVPGLIWSLTNDDEEGIRATAADALLRYKSPSLLPVLRKALDKETDESARISIVKTMIASGLNENEMVSDLEAFEALPEKAPNQQGQQVPDPATVPAVIAIGEYLSNGYDASDSFSRKVLERIYALQKTDPSLAQKLLKVAQPWHTHSTDVDVIRRIGAGTADAPMIEDALDRVEKLRETVGDELAVLTEGKGVNRAIGLVLIDDGQGILDILKSNDKQSATAALACARLVGKSLPVNVVSKLFETKDERLSAAAERYLEAEDSFESRQLLWSRHPNQALILGWAPPNHPPTGTPSTPSYEQEKAIHDDVLKEDGPDDIIAVVTESEFFDYSVRIKNGKGVLRSSTDKSRYMERLLTDIELQELRDYVTANNFEREHSQYSNCMGCFHMELVEVTRQKGIRINVPVVSPVYRFPPILAGLLAIFDKDMRTGERSKHVMPYRKKYRGQSYCFPTQINPSARYGSKDRTCDYRYSNSLIGWKGKALQKHG